MDPDLIEYQRQNALSALSNRNTDKGLESINRPATRKRRPNPLFDVNESDLSEDERLQLTVGYDDEDDDEALSFAIQASLDQTTHSARSDRPVASSSKVTLDSQLSSGPQAPSHRLSAESSSPSAASEDFDDIYIPPSRLSTALKFAHSHSEPSVRKVSGESSFGMTSLLTPSMPEVAKKAPIQGEPDEDADMEGIEISIPAEVSQVLSSAIQPSDDGQSGLQNSSCAERTSIDREDPLTPTGLLAPQQISPIVPPASTLKPVVEPAEDSRTIPAAIAVDDSDSDMVEVAVDAVSDQGEGDEGMGDSDSEMEEAHVEATSIVPANPESVLIPSSTLPPTAAGNKLPTTPSSKPALAHSTLSSTSQFQLDTDSSPFIPTDEAHLPSPQPPAPAPYTPPQPLPHVDEFDLDLEDQNQDHETHDPSEHQEGEFDAADEMDPHAEEGQFAEFLSQVKGRDLHDVRREIDDEIIVLNQQKKAAMRDAEDITQQMVNQIMVSGYLSGCLHPLTKSCIRLC